MLPTPPPRKPNANAVALAREIAQSNQDTLLIQKLLTFDESLKKLVALVDGRWVDSGLKASLEKSEGLKAAPTCPSCGKVKQKAGPCEDCEHEDTPPPPSTPLPLPPSPPSPSSAPPTPPSAPSRSFFPSRAAFVAPGARVPSRGGADLAPTRPATKNENGEAVPAKLPPKLAQEISQVGGRFANFGSNKASKNTGSNEKKGGDYSSQSAATVLPEPPSRDRLKFSTMTNDFPAMMAQATAGLKQISAMKDMVQRFVKMEQENAKRMEKALAEEAQRMNKAQESDGIILFSGVWTELFMAMNEKVECSKNAAERIIEEVVDPLNTLEKTATMTLKSINTTMKAHEQDLKKVVDIMNKTKDTCKKSLQAMHECQEKEKIEVNPKKKSELGEKITTLRKQAGENATAVVNKIVEANRANDFFAAGVRSCIDQLEEFETQRIVQLTTRLDRWMSLLRETDEQQMNHSESAVNVVHEINPEHCIQTFIFDWMVDFGNPTVIEPFVYDLPLSLNEIQAGTASTKGFQMFNVSLTQLLEREKSSSVVQSPGKPLDVPVIMHVLCDAIKSMGGFHTPAIFRISVDVNLLADLQRQFDSGNFSLDQMKGDPHVPACLLKLWLRSLTEPIIPRNLYQLATQGLQEMKSSAVAVRRETRIQLGPRAALAPNARLPSSKAPDSQGHVMSVIAKLIPAYQALARRIALLARDVVDQSAANQMSYDSLAVVFAPTFFRTPKPDDPNEGIQQFHREKLFVMEFFIAFAQQTNAK